MSASVFSQTQLSGVINQYSKVVSIDGTDRVSVDNPAPFSVGDTVMIVQMKGMYINTTNDPAQYGSRQNANNVGNYELLLVLSVTGNQIVFTADLSKTYVPEGSVQLIKVRGYDNAVVTGELTCQPWDSVSGTGGVLALLVGNTLELNASINVSGKGFIGGAPVDGNGDCSEVDAGYTDMYFTNSADSAGYKGEGLATYSFSMGSLLSPGYMKGMGPSFNGGGGGNALYSGGGGGANYGSGGAGGLESSSCGTPGTVGGLASYNITDINNWNSDNRIFMGGGGGSGTQSGGDLGTQGGNGGGIIVLVADTLVGNGFGITSNGESVLGIASAGAGGGGAGGMILLDIGDLQSTVLIETKGGNGGITNNTNCTGPGGGGGGGIIWRSNPAGWGNATTDTSGGAKGVSLNGTCTGWFGGDGEAGSVLSAVSMQLSGFLFNTIFSAASGEINDTICEGETVPKLLGSLPKGGTFPYNYTWESSNDKTNWTVETSGPTEQSLNLLTTLFDTTYYRRTVTDASVPAITDVSKVLTIVVQPKIQQNLFSFDTTICYNQTPNPILPVYGMPVGGDGIYTYLWEESTDGITYTDASGVNTNNIYQPPALTTTTYYRRNVYSGKCQNISDTVTVTVLPLIGGNSIAADQTLCQGEAFSPLNGPVPTGGNGSFLYQWVESADSILWSGAYGTGTNQNYAPDTTSSTFPGTTYFRRIVYSGPANTCIDTSNALTLLQWPKITGNTIAADQQICEGVVPVPLTGMAPGGGDGSYTFLWQQSNDNVAFTDATETNTNNDYIPAALVDTTYYRRIITSDVCRDTSANLTITVDPAIQYYGINLPSQILDTTICENQQPGTLVQEPTPVSGGDGVYVYSWEQSTDGGSSWTGTGGTASSFTPGNLPATTLYRRGVTSGACQVISDTVTINVLVAIAGNTLPADYAVCTDDATLVDGSTPGSGGDGSYSFIWEQSPDASSWSNASGNNLSEDYQTPVLNTLVYYRRIVTSGPASTCQDTTAAMQIDILPLPTGSLAALDTSLCEGESVDLTFQVNGVSSPWNITYDDGFGNTAVAVISSTAPTLHNITPPGSGATVLYTYSITDLTDNAGCSASPSGITGTANVSVDGLPTADAGPDDEVCGFSYTLAATPPLFGSLNWIVPAGVTLSDTFAANTEATVVAEGTYDLTLQRNNGVCPVQEDIISLTFWQEPGAVHAGNDTILEPGSTVIDLMGTQDQPAIGVINWSTDGGANIISPNALLTSAEGLDPGENLFTLSVSNGSCPVKEDQIKVSIQDFSQYNYGISPNGDGINDYLRINGADNVNNTLTIFDGQGFVVYKTDNFMHSDTQSSEGWNGTTNELSPLPEGTYYYVLKIHGNENKTLTGFIVIKRSQ